MQGTFSTLASLFGVLFNKLSNAFYQCVLKTTIDIALAPSEVLSFCLRGAIATIFIRNRKQIVSPRGRAEQHHILNYLTQFFGKIVIHG